uniref:Uncharacterized protein n=1 Tax=Arundo donax TaxID=35708 RepID=A0A0A8ZKZ1_ARUDO
MSSTGAPKVIGAKEGVNEELEAAYDTMFQSHRLSQVITNITSATSQP